LPALAFMPFLLNNDALTVKVRQE